MALESFRPSAPEQVKAVQDSVDDILLQFPEELQEKLEQKIDGMDELQARDYLLDRLAQRNTVLAKNFEESLSSGMEAAKKIPEAFKNAVAHSISSEDSKELGTGRSAQVFQSLDQDRVCYKALRVEVVRQLQKRVVREGLYQYAVHELLKNNERCAQAPEVLLIADDGELQVLMMEKVDGRSLAQVFADPSYTLPKQFDVDLFFEKIENALEEMHSSGYFHRDLTNNAGNVMIDKGGNPWIIDFGSAVKSLDPSSPSSTFQLQVGGPHYLSTDLDGVRILKRHMQQYMHSKEMSHE